MKRIFLFLLIVFGFLYAEAQQSLTVKDFQIGANVRVNRIKTVFGGDTTSALGNKILPTMRAVVLHVNDRLAVLYNYVNTADTIYTDGSLEFVSGYLRVTRAVIQTHTTGATATVANTTTWLQVNPASTLAALEIEFPAEPIEGQELLVTFGGSMTSGEVVTALTLDGGGTTFIYVAAPTSGDAGEHLRFKFSGTFWFKI